MGDIARFTRVQISLKPQTVTKTASVWHAPDSTHTCVCPNVQQMSTSTRQKLQKQLIGIMFTSFDQFKSTVTHNGI